MIKQRLAVEDIYNSNVREEPFISDSWGKISIDTIDHCRFKWFSM